MEKIGKTLVSATKFLSDEINKIDGFKAPLFNSYHFNEFVIQSKNDINRIHKKLVEKGVDPGLVLNKQFPKFGNTMLCTVSETHSKEDLLTLVNGLKEV